MKKNVSRWSVGCALLVATLSVSACSGSGNVDERKREYLASGDALFKKEDFPAAVIQYRNAIQLDPRFGEARKKLALAYLSTGEGAAAFREFLAAADLLPDDAEAQLNAARALIDVRRFEEARARAQKALEIDPKSVEAIILRANALVGLNKLDDAITEVQTAIRENPERMGSYATLGSMQVAQGRLDEAEASFKRALELDPKSLPARMALANFLWARKRMPEAEALLKEVLAQEPNNVTANRGLAIFNMGAGRMADAEPFLKTAALAAPNNSVKLELADYYMATKRDDDSRRLLEEIVAQGKDGYVPASLRLAGADVAKGDRAAAAARIEQVLARESTNVEALGVKTQLLLADKKLDEAFAVAQTAVRVAPQSAAAHYTLGHIYSLRHQDVEATKEFSDALKLNPKMANANLELAKIRMRAGDLDAAALSANAAIEALPNYIEAHVVLARIYLMKGEPSRAEPFVRSVSKAAPDFPFIQGELGQLELARNNRPAARAAFQRALTQDPAALDAIAGLVTMDIQDKRLPEARARVDAAVQASPDDEPVQLFAGRAYISLGDNEKGEATLKRAAALNPNGLDAYGLLGRLYFTQNRYDEAVAQFTTLAQKDPRPTTAYTFLGMLKKAQNRTAEARKDFERALEIDPKNGAAANDLAWMMVEGGENLDVALELSQRAKASLPNRPDITDTLGWIYFKKGLHSQAASTLREAAEQDPKNPVYQYHLGMAYAAMQDVPKARAALQLATANNPTYKGVDEARQTLASLR